ncbi:hypothetical protein BGW39_011239 [Mortierella sp. 14UC]|nr:hypothetical protein BGW39_011239 [Mortierella sp. 14UC]
MRRQSARIKERQQRTLEAAPVSSGSSSDRLVKTPANPKSTTQRQIATASSKKGRYIEDLSDNKTSSDTIDQRQRAGKKMISASTRGSTKQQSPTTPFTPSIIVNPIKSSDPPVVLPVEIWHMILSFLPISTIARSSVVSKSWLEGSRSHPIWRRACETGGLGGPNEVYKSWMALACAHSFWICELCLSISKGESRSSHIPLRASIDEPDHHDPTLQKWMCCHACRLKYDVVKCEGYEFGRIFPELNHDSWDCFDGILSINYAQVYYALTLSELGTHNYSGSFVGHEETETLAVKVHGGSAGVLAAYERLAQKRQVEFERRARAFRLARRSKTKALSAFKTRTSMMPSGA